MSLSIASITARIRAEVNSQISLFRIRDGYFLLTYADDGIDPSSYREQSVMVSHVRDLSMTKWIEEARQFFETVKEGR